MSSIVMEIPSLASSSGKWVSASFCPIFAIKIMNINQIKNGIFRLYKIKLYTDLI